ncbi:MAG: methyltransferase domain-containing protein [Anaerolineaceae bacterium]|nr:MAG: methyltransferase domain-containing protein [Anaerolineaceae bacterium]
MFTKSAAFYDTIYAFKDYEREAQRIVEIISEHQLSGGNRLLDVACGTGRHLEFLRETYEVEGLDLSQELLDIARERIPDVLFHHADMMDFNLAREYDVVMCLFSSIGYVKTLDNLHRTVKCMSNHLVGGGILIIEPWFPPDAWNPGTVHANYVDDPELKIARINISCVEGRLSLFDFHYLVGTPEGVDYFVERHELGLFEKEEMSAAMKGSGLEVTYDDEGLTDRGLFIGRKPK